MVEEAGLEFYGIPSGKLRRYFSLRNVSDIIRVGAGFFAALSILKKERPALLFSKGGFVSVPPCGAAKSLNIPVITHESDYSPGLANRLNSRFAERIFVSYRESAAFFSGAAGGKTCVSGNPVRPEFAAADPAAGRAFLGLGDDERILLVLGGSLGSAEINDLVKACLPMLTKYYTVVHQTGETKLPEASGRYKPFAFIKHELPHIIAASELVLCRSGAGTIWECKSLKKPMVLIPLRGSGTRGDQVENARLFRDRGAAICFTPDQNDTLPETAGKLSALIASLAEDPEKRKNMEEALISESSGTGAAEFIAREIVQRLKEKP